MVRATAEPVEGSKIRLSVEVEEPEVDRVLGDAVRAISRRVGVPGFRPGRAPRQVLEARMGGAVAVRTEALREAIPGFYAQAVVDAGVDPIAPPEFDITGGEEHGPLEFDAVVQVRPTVAIPGYAGLRVTVPSPEVTDEEVDAQVDRVRDVDAELLEVVRPAGDGDHVTIDLKGVDPAGERSVDVDDFLYEVGSGRVAPELDDELRGAKVGDILAFRATPAATPDELSFQVLVKAVKEKTLPPLTDEWVAESSEFATVDDLRADVRQRVGRAKIARTRLVLQDGAVDALLELVDDDEVPEVLVDEEVRQQVDDLQHRLEARQIGLGQYLEAIGRTGEELVAEARTGARRAVKADLALRALSGAEGLEITEAELEDALAALEAVTGDTGGRSGAGPDALHRQVDHARRTLAVRSERNKAKALEWLVDHVELVDEEGRPVPRDLLEEGLTSGDTTSGDTTSGDTTSGDTTSGDTTSGDTKGASE